MTRKQIVNKLLRTTELTTSQATHAVEGIINIFTEALVKGEPIFMRGFGTLKIVTRKAKPARNISKGTIIVVPAHNAVKFVAYKKLQERIDSANNEPKALRKVRKS